MNEKIVLEQILYNGDSNGLIKVLSSNWNIVCYKMPRNKFNDIKEYCNAPGVYILVGKENEQFNYYIGESDDILKRLKQHILREDFWNYAIFFIGNEDQPIDKTIAKYLEARLCEIAFANRIPNQYKLKNGNCPKGTNVSEVQLVKATNYLNNIRTIIGSLGYNIFDRTPAEITKVDDKNLLYIRKANKGINAIAVRIDKGFKVFKNSTAAMEMTEATTQCFKDYNNKLKEDEIIKDGVFMVDYVFGTPSGAAVQVLGRNANGNTEWKDSDGKMLKDIIAEELKK